LQRLLDTLINRQLTPAIVFSFSRKDCEGAAMTARNLEPMAAEQVDTINAIFEAAICTLSADDQQLDSVQRILPLLQRGVAVHHSGLLPVLKEVVELLFQENLVRVLFATETFAMGVNMPARTVVFTSLRKWDGESFRLPSGGEYVQMSGRAGRRGIDTQGTVVVLLAEPLGAEEFCSMLKGGSVPLTSSFRLRYNTLLKLYTMESLQPEALISHSLHAFQSREPDSAIAEQQAALMAEAVSLQREDEGSLERMLELRQSAAALRARAAASALQPRNVARWLQPGRLVLLEAGGGDTATGEQRLGWGVVVVLRTDDVGRGGGPDAVRPGDWTCGNCGANVYASKVACFKCGAPKPPPQELAAQAAVKEAAAAAAAAEGEHLVVDVLVPLAAGSSFASASGGAFAIAPLSDVAAEGHVVPVRLACLRQLSAVRLWLPKDLRPLRNRRLVLEALREAASERRFGGLAAAASAGDTAAGVPHAAMLSPGDLQSGGECAAALLEASQVEAQLANLIRAHSLRAGLQQPAEARTAAAASTAAAEVHARLDVLERRKELLESSALLAREAAPMPAEEEFGTQMAKMQDVLRRLQCLDEANVVRQKGRAAAEVDASDELLAAELIFGGFFNSLTAAAATALCACLIADQSEKIKRPQPPHADLAPAVAELQSVARELCTVYNAAGLETDERTYLERFDGSMINVIYAWCGGATFGELCGMCDLFEGSIIRSIRRLGELLEEMQSAAKAIGNEELFEKFVQGAKLIQRDIVFAASLYVEA
tara:strand:- start:297 stop:2612 length:2316 start_codon:yes stop_codon:yes gene_type:complete